MLSRENPYQDYYIMIGSVFFAILWTVIILHGTNEDTDGSVVEHGRYGRVVEHGRQGSVRFEKCSCLESFGDAG